MTRLFYRIALVCSAMYFVLSLNTDNHKASGVCLLLSAVDLAVALLLAKHIARKP